MSVTKHKISFDKASNLLDLVFMVTKDHEGTGRQKYPVFVYQQWIKKSTINTPLPQI